ncbi:MAG: molybdenum cofactor guanylyltransferase [Flavobacteriales bacterium]|nr:molybdenum cofactor guanylyltransferase [Flavobacteriales bacterium]
MTDHYQQGPEGWTGVVLAGGRSSRMGRDKALMDYQGRPLIQHAIDVLHPHVDELLIIGDPLLYDRSGALAIADDAPGNGPLGGIVTALRYAWNERMIILACDMPHVPARFLTLLKGALDEHHEAVVAQCDGRLEPLAAVYTRRCRHPFASQVQAGRLKMSDAIEQVRTRYVQICPGEDGWPSDLFRNINAPSDL